MTGSSARLLLEREDELAALSTALDDSRRNHGRLVTVVGEAGAGKTSVVEAFAEDAGVSVLWGWCDPIVPPRPLGSVIDLADAAGWRLPTDSDPWATFEMVVDRLRTKPAVVVIEDLHWADALTIDFVRFLARRISTTNSLVITTVRSDEIGDDHLVWAALAELGRGGRPSRLDIPALTIRAIGQLASATDLDPLEIEQLTGGNAFYVSEVVASSGATAPSVGAAVLARLAQVDHDIRSLVHDVAVSPRSLPIAVVRRLAEGRDGTVDGLVRTGLLNEVDGDLRFRHELARAALEAAMPPASRARRHRRLLDVLIETGIRDVSWRAFHALQSGDADAITRWVPEAARHASRLGAARESARWFEAALDHAEGFADHELAVMHEQIAGELHKTDLNERAVEHAGHAIEWHGRLGDARAIARALILRGQARWLLADLNGARADRAAAIDLLVPLGPSDQLADAHLADATSWMLARRLEQARRAVARSRGVFASTPDAAGSQLGRIESVIELAMGDADSAIAELESELERVRACGDTNSEVLLLGWLGSGSGERRRYDKAVRYLPECIDLANSLDRDGSASYHEAWLARVAFEQGRWDEAGRIGEQIEGSNPLVVATALGVLGRVRVRRGDAGASEALTDALRHGERAEVQHIWSPTCGLAELAWLEQRSEDVAGVLDGLALRVAETDSEWGRGEVAFWQWRAGLDHITDLLAEPFRLQIEGDWRGAAEAWHAIGCPYEEAMALTDGDEAAVRAAIEILDGLGARPLAAMARGRLRELGVVPPSQPRRSTAANPAGLTRRQMDVLGLIVEGLDNGEIAGRLYVSKKTVEHHVSAIFSRLGVDSRAKAIAMALADDLVGATTP